MYNSRLLTDFHELKLNAHPVGQLRVLLVSQYALPKLGGLETAVENLAVGLVKAGHRSTILTSSCGEGAIPETRVRRVRVRAWNGLERIMRVPYPIFSPALDGALRAEIADCDVVHIHGFLFHSSIIALRLAGRAGKPVVVTEHVGFTRYPSPLLNFAQRTAFQIFTRRFLRSAATVICLNHRVQDWLRDQMPDPGKLRLVPNGIDLTHFRPASPEEKLEARLRLGISPHRPVVLFVGRFVPKKHVERLLIPFDGTFDLVLCGPDLPEGNHKAVRHICVPPSEMPTIYRAADVFALPSEGEGFPMSVMEAMASGLSAVVCRDRAYEGQVDDTEIVQTEVDVAAFHRAIKDLLGDPGRRARIGDAARKRAVADFGVTRSTARHVEIYEGAMAGSPGRRA